LDGIFSFQPRIYILAEGSTFRLHHSQPVARWAQNDVHGSLSKLWWSAPWWCPFCERLWSFSALSVAEPTIARSDRLMDPPFTLVPRSTIGPRRSTRDTRCHKPSPGRTLARQPTSQPMGRPVFVALGSVRWDRARAARRNALQPANAFLHVPLEQPNPISRASILASTPAARILSPVIEYTTTSSLGQELLVCRVMLASSGVAIVVAF
jgi:hypothetical protein